MATLNAAADDTEASDEATENVTTKEMAAETESLKQKYYGILESMRPAGSLEERRSKIYKELDSHLFKNIPDIDRYDYLDYDIVGTYADYVVVSVYNRDFKAAYRIDYTLDDNTLTLGDMTEVRIGFQAV